MPKRRAWEREELLVALRLYCITPFGKLHRKNQDIIALSRLLDRTPSAVSMKACNFASLDPLQQKRNVAGLGNASRADRELWDRFQEDAELVAAEAEEAYARLTAGNAALADVEEELELPEGPTEVKAITRSRRVQSFFREAVLSSYEYSCALSDLAVPELLNASHIIPWKSDKKRRGDPRNGIALNVLYDRAFDRGLITIDKSLCVVLSERLQTADPPVFHSRALLALEGRRLKPPTRFEPDPEALAYHRENIFRA